MTRGVFSYQREGTTSLAELFRVYSLPRLVLVDKEGKVAAIGGSLDALDRIEKPRASRRTKIGTQAADTPPEPAAVPTAGETVGPDSDHQSDQSHVGVPEADTPQHHTDKAGR